MNQWSRILIPAALGVAAFVINSWTVSQAIAPRYYTVVNRNVAGGETIDASMLNVIEMSGNHDRLKEVLLPWDQRSIILGTQIRRGLLAGDPVMRLDIDWNENYLGPGDVQVTVPMGLGSFEPSLLNPGDRVNFILELSRGEELKPLGPLKVVAIGSRTRIHNSGGRSDRANSMTVAVQKDSPLHQALQSVVSYGSVKSIELLPPLQAVNTPQQLAAN